MNLTRWEKGDKPSASHLNEAVDAINEHLPVVAGPGVETRISKHGGTVVQVVDRHPLIHTILPGRITTAGPDSEADFSDYRYWVRLDANHTTETNKGPTDELDMQEVEEPEADSHTPSGTSVIKDHIVCAYNLAEYLDGSHSMSDGDKVLIVQLWPDSPQVEDANIVLQRRWFILTGGVVPSGQYAFQQLTMVSANQVGWSFNRLHGLLPNS